MTDRRRVCFVVTRLVVVISNIGSSGAMRCESTRGEGGLKTSRDENEGTHRRSGEGEEEPALCDPGSEFHVCLSSGGREKEKIKSAKKIDGMMSKKIKRTTMLVLLLFIYLYVHTAVLLLISQLVGVCHPTININNNTGVNY